MRKRKFKHRQPIEILWIDSTHDTSGWQKESKIDYENIRKNMFQTTIGYFIKDSKDWLTVAQSVELGNKDWISNLWTVPKGCIKSIKKLRKNRR